MRTVTLAVLLAAVAGCASAASAATGFRSPSGNIGCFIGASSGVRCDIAKRDWSPPHKPASCDLDYGQGISLGGGRAHFVCAGDTALGAGRVLGYGKILTAGRYSCTSQSSGMTCRNRTTGHGFFLSRQRYRLF